MLKYGDVNRLKGDTASTEEEQSGDNAKQVSNYVRMDGWDTGGDDKVGLEGNDGLQTVRE